MPLVRKGGVAAAGLQAVGPAGSGWYRFSGGESLPSPPAADAAAAGGGSPCLRGWKMELMRPTPWAAAMPKAERMERDERETEPPSW